MLSQEHAVTDAELVRDRQRPSKLLDAVVASLPNRDGAAIAEAWRGFAHSLRCQIDLEEHETFRALERAYAQEAAELALEHTRILRLVERIGVELTSAGMTVNVLLTQLQSQLRQHAEHEERTLQRCLGGVSRSRK